MAQQEERVHSVGLESLNHTAKELMHHSEETREAPPVPLPTIHVAGDPPIAGTTVCQARVGLVQLKGMLPATLSPSLFSCSTGWCVQVAGVERSGKEFQESQDGGGGGRV